MLYSMAFYSYKYVDYSRYSIIVDIFLSVILPVKRSDRELLRMPGSTLQPNSTRMNQPVK